jgi:hypothetical protein
MTCSECHREHLIEGQVSVDGYVIPMVWHESTVEIMCRFGKLGILKPEDDRLVEPDE